MQWQAVVDRIEGDVAVLLYVKQDPEEGFEFELPLQLLPPKTKEGDYLTVTWEIDQKSTEAARKRVTDILDRLINRQDN